MLFELDRNLLSAEALLTYVRWEPNLKLVQRATRDYLRNRSCSATEEFIGVNEIVELFQQKQLENPGAVLAGLLSMADRRINSIIRLLRTGLSLADIRDFTRIHPLQLCAASIEFYLDWLLELQQKHQIQKFNMVCSALTLMVLHDESGTVEDYVDDAHVGFRQSKPVFSTSFEDYIQTIEPALKSLGSLQECEKTTQAMVATWHQHCSVAREMRGTNPPEQQDQAKSN